MDLRRDGVAIRLATDTEDFYGLTERCWATPTARTVLRSCATPRRRASIFCFQQMDAPRPQRNRIHVDAWLGGEHL